jgi:hypothetical protein
VIRDIPIGESCGPQSELVEDRCQEPGESREIRVPRVKGTGTSTVSKSQKNWNRSLGRTHGRHRFHRGKSRQESVHRSLAHRDFVDPVDEGFVHFEIAKRETTMG